MHQQPVAGKYESLDRRPLVIAIVREVQNDGHDRRAVIACCLQVRAQK